LDLSKHRDNIKTSNLLTIEKYIEKRKKKVENHVHTLQIYEECKNSKANCQTGQKLVWWSQIGEIDEYGSTETKSAANSERGLPQGTPGTVDDKWSF
jgi:hypothetical protein